MEASHRYHHSLLRLVVVNALIKPVWILGIDRWVQNEVGLATYGSYFSIFGITLTVGFLLDFGLSTQVQREAAENKIPAAHLTDLFFSKLFLLFLYFIAIALIGWLNPSIPKTYLWGIAVLQALQSFYLYFRSWVTASQQFAADVWFSILDKVLLISLSLVWLIGNWKLFPINLSVFIWLQGITISVSILCVCYFLFYQRISFIGKFRLSLGFLRRTWPYALIVLLMSAHTRLDGYWLLRWHPHGEWEAGRFAAGYRLLDAVNMFGYLVASFLLPYLARHAGKDVLTRHAIQNARWGLLTLSVGTIVIVLIFPGALANLLYAKDAAILSTSWPVLFGSLLGYSLIHVYGTALTAWGELRVFRWVIGLALLLHLFISVSLIPILGALGSAWATWVSQLLAGLYLMYFVHRRLGGPQPYASYLVVIFTSCAIWFFH